MDDDGGGWTEDEDQDDGDEGYTGDVVDADCCLFVFGHDVDVFDDAHW